MSDETIQPELTETPSERRSAKAVFWGTAPARLAEDWKVFGLIFIVLMSFYMPGLGDYGLYDPWETHYGEVARNMVETDNYIDPFWGSPWDPQGVKRERAGFYSKPPLTMWLMAIGMNLFGYNEFGVRFCFPLLMILALLAIYLSVSRFFNRRVGILATIVTGSAPFVAFMSRQAVTDGPLVALMTIGMMSLSLGLFRCDEDEQASPLLYGFTVGAFLLVMLGQLWAILPLDRSPDIIRPYAGSNGPVFAIQWWFQEVFTVGAGKGWALASFLLPVGIWAATRVARQRRRSMMYIYIFYICCGLVVPAKGWLGWAPMGSAIIGYLIVTGEWKILARVDIPTGLLVVLMTGHPWIFAMLTGHHPAWWNRFIIHDHYKRLFSGVHSIDDGGFEYFFKWVGYGLFPWIGLLPGAIIKALGGLKRKEAGYTPSQKFKLLMLMWVFFGFFLFTKSSTKFHHYIFPIVPPLAIFIALFLEDALVKRGRQMVLMLVCAAGITVWVGQDIYRMPAAFGQGSQNMVNLFTYKYDREWPKYTAPSKLEKLKDDKRVVAEQDNTRLRNLADPIKLITIIAIFGLLLLTWRRQWLREYGALVLIYSGGWCALWCLQSYLPDIAKDWSQKDMWDSYYAHCSPYGPDENDAFKSHLLQTSSRIPSKLDIFPRGRCKEPVVAFRTNWRGETFYSANTVLPSMETKHLKPFLEQWGNDKPFYLFTERSRIKSELEPKLPKHLKGQYCEIFNTNKKFVMLRIEAGMKGAEAPTCVAGTPSTDAVEEKPLIEAEPAPVPAALDNPPE